MLLSLCITSICCCFKSSRSTDKQNNRFSHPCKLNSSSLGLASFVHYLTGQRSIYIRSCAGAYPHSSEWKDNLQPTHMGMIMLICWGTLNRFANWREFSKSQVIQLHPNYIKESCRVVSLRADCILLFSLSVDDKTWKHSLSDWTIIMFFSHFSIFVIIVSNVSGLQFFSILSLHTDWLFLPRTFSLLSDNNTIK